METIEEVKTESKTIIRFEEKIKWFQNVLKLKKTIKLMVERQIEDKKKRTDSAKSSSTVRSFQLTAYHNFYNAYKGKIEPKYFFGGEEYRKCCYYKNTYEKLEEKFG